MNNTLIKSPAAIEFIVLKSLASLSLPPVPFFPVLTLTCTSPNCLVVNLSAGTEFLSLPGPPPGITTISSGLILNTLATKFFIPSSSFIVVILILFLYLPDLNDLTLF